MSTEKHIRQKSFPFDVARRATEQEIRALLWAIIDASQEPKLTAEIIADKAHQQFGAAAHPLRLKRIAGAMLKTGFTKRRGFE